MSARMFHALVVVGAGLGGCGPQVDVDDAGDGSGESGASGTATSGMTSASTSGPMPGTTVGPGVSTSDVDDGSDGSCPPGDGCKLDLGGGIKLDVSVPRTAQAYECCLFGEPCADGLECDMQSGACTTKCEDVTDCPAPPFDGTAVPTCAGERGMGICMLDCSIGECARPAYCDPAVVLCQACIFPI